VEINCSFSLLSAAASYKGAFGPFRLGHFGARWLKLRGLILHCHGEGLPLHPEVRWASRMPVR